MIKGLSISTDPLVANFFASPTSTKKPVEAEQVDEDSPVEDDYLDGVPPDELGEGDEGADLEEV